MQIFTPQERSNAPTQKEEERIIMTKVKIIANPVAGRGAAEKAIPLVERTLKEMNVRFHIVRTERPWHACQLAKEAASEGWDVVAAMGGDGTANEVINGLMQAKISGYRRCALEVLCIGRGNDFAYGVGIPSDLHEGCHVLARGTRRTIDLGRVVVDSANPGRYFGNGIGIGFDAVVGFEALKMKHLHGFLSYLVAALKTLLFYYQAPLVRMEYNGQSITQAALMISIMNGQRMGGGFWMAPDGKPDDGLLNLCIAGKANRLRLFNLMFHFMKGTQAGKDPITTDRTRRITIEAVQGVLPAHSDGETLCTQGKRMEVELLPHSLEIIWKPE